MVRLSTGDIKVCSIIVTHYSDNDERSATMRESIASLIETTKNYPAEIIVVDNGKRAEDSAYLLMMAHEKKISAYVRNANNMSFGYSRNLGIKISNGDYICIADNDIEYQKGWLEACIEILESYPDKAIYATPIAYPMTRKYAVGNLGDHQLDMRAGSNCFVIRRPDFMEIGMFLNHRIAGTKWTDSAVRHGYYACITKEQFVKDRGFRKGYNFKQVVDFNIPLTNGEVINKNED